jgi:hypothetical protein
VDLGLDAVLLTADHADLDLEDDVGLVARLLEHALAISRFSSSGTAEPSHMCDWNSGLSPLHALLRDGHERRMKVSSLSLGQWSVCRATLIGYFFAIDVRELGQRHRTGDHVLDALSGGELGAAPGELDDAVALGLGEPAEGRDDGSGRRCS